MQPHVTLSCPEHRLALTPEPGRWACASGCRFPVEDGIARFVGGESYAGSFGLQWRRMRETQLDSVTGQPISRRRLERLLGGSLAPLEARDVLEAGCGAGRFTEVLLDAGARVFATDLSRAVEANRVTCEGRPGYFVCQADLRRLPVEPRQFDFVLCIGVLQHTPDPEAALAALAEQLKPGGVLVVDHYRRGAPAGAARQLVRALYPKPLLRQLLLRVPAPVALAATRALVGLLWPLHRASPSVPSLRRLLLRFSPVHDYRESLPELDERTLRAWALLDTHDDLTDRYKHGRSADEIAGTLTQLGLTDIAVNDAEVIEARARRPR
jgi:SAM-dependent methyltransferase